MGKGVTGGWRQKLKVCLRGRVTVQAGSSDHHRADRQAGLEVDQFLRHGKISSLQACPD